MVERDWSEDVSWIQHEGESEDKGLKIQTAIPYHHLMIRNEEESVLHFFSRGLQPIL